MSIVTLQLGQCGNQVGQALFSTIIEDLATGDCRRCPPINSARPASAAFAAALEADDAYSEASRARFFQQPSGGSSSSSQPMRARAVLCDAEEKVVSVVTQAAAMSGSWAYPEKAKVCLKRGSGNNWAQGYCRHGPKCWPELADVVRRQAEGCDRLDGFLSLMSLAGGTGSGLGTFVCEQVRDEYPEAQLISGLVWPHSRGEVSVQAYNSLLTAAHLTAACDALLLFENDRLQDACERRLGLASVSVGHLNAMIGHQLGACLQPATNASAATHPAGPALAGLVGALCPHPDLRLLQLRTLPYASERAKEFSAFAWPGLIRHLRQMLLAGAAVEEGLDWRLDATSASRARRQRCFASRLHLRGLGAIGLGPADWEPLRLPELHPDWLPESDRITVCRTGRPYHGYERSCALVSNCASAVDTLDGALARAWSMFSVRAFVHQYARFGLEEGAFLDCFAAAEQTVYNYRNL